MLKSLNVFFCSAESGSGKSTFINLLLKHLNSGIHCLQTNTFRTINMIFFLFLDIPVYVQTREPTDFSELPNINFLTTDFAVNETCCKSIPNNSVIILDDFAFKQSNSKHDKAEFLKIVNYTLRHHKITLILVIHNLYNTNLSTEILLAPHIFLAYSNLGYYIMR
jgi:hypothetical protein